MNLLRVNLYMTMTALQIEYQTLGLKQARMDL